MTKAERKKVKKALRNKFAPRALFSLGYIMRLSRKGGKNDK